MVEDEEEEENAESSSSENENESDMEIDEKFKAELKNVLGDSAPNSEDEVKHILQILFFLTSFLRKFHFSRIPFLR